MAKFSDFIFSIIFKIQNRHLDSSRDYRSILHQTHRILCLADMTMGLKSWRFQPEIYGITVGIS